MKFRQDINGLRAVAVAAVVLFHFRVAGFVGGFIGVDVFFVISGFLMTQIIVTRIEAGRFSIPGFYFDRARRIIPALAVMLLAVLAAGYIIAPPDDYRLLGKHAVSAALFFSNAAFYSEVNYFEPASAENWLLHTWSLAVEWQFYLVYPLFLLLLDRVAGLRAIRWGVVAAAIASFALCLVMAQRNATGAFYLSPPRAWEMLAGGLVFLFPLRLTNVTVQRAVEWTGIAAIAFCAFMLSSDAGWPGWMTALPILATAAVLAVHRTESRILGSPPVAMLGRISYSVYLWHWPVTVGLLYLELSEDVRWRLVGLALSLVLGWLSYRLIELPTAKLGRASTRPASPFHPALRDHALFAAMVGLIVVPSVVAWKTNGLPARVPDRVRVFAATILPDQTLRRNCFAEGAVQKPCLLGDAGKPIDAVLIGDSHALAMAPVVEAAMQSLGKGPVYFRAYPGCATIVNAGYPQKPGDRCLLYNQTYLPPLMNGQFAGRPVIFINSVRGLLLHSDLRFVDPTGVTPFSTAAYEARFTQTLCGISAHHPTAMMTVYPDWDFDVAAQRTRQLMLSSHPAPFTQTLAEHRARHAEEVALLQRVAARCGVTLLDPAPILCPQGLCTASDGDHSKYYNAYHLNDFGSAPLMPLFRDYLAKIFLKASTADSGPAKASSTG